MLNITILALGKLKEKYWAEAEKEYLKRLSSYTKIKIIELPEEAFTEKDNIEMIKKKEANKIQKNIPDNGFVIALHERGEKMTSPDLANFLENNSTKGENLVFIIGGPRGLHSDILNSTHKQISLSQLTFPHQMVRTILLEQIYRSVTIIQGKSYHY